MLTLTVILIALGAVLAALGTAGFTAIWRSPGATDHDSLQIARRLATVGRWLGGIELAQYALSGYGANPAVVKLLLAAVLIVAASVATKANPALRQVRPG
jgi:fructose-specific phosphotransferase system IIC component